MSQTYLGKLVRIKPEILHGGEDLRSDLLGGDDDAFIEETHNGLEDTD